MAFARPVPRAGGRSQRHACRAGLLLLAVLAFTGCNVRDRLARQDVEVLESSVLQMESSLQARQTGINEQVRELREEQARLEGLIEEQRRGVKNLGQRVDVLRDKTQEDLLRGDKALQEQAQAANASAARLGERIDGLQKGLQTVNDNLLAVGAYEKKQEERIAQIQGNLQGQLKVIVDEVGQENQNLEKSVAALRGDLEASQSGLGELQKTMQQLADGLAALQGQVQDLAKRQEAQRRTAAARNPPGQHTVRAGETLTGIASRYGVSLQDLMDRNKIADPNDLREGQKLLLPGP